MAERPSQGCQVDCIDRQSNGFGDHALSAPGKLRVVEIVPEESLRHVRVENPAPVVRNGVPGHGLDLRVQRVEAARPILGHGAGHEHGVANAAFEEADGRRHGAASQRVADQDDVVEARLIDVVGHRVGTGGQSHRVQWYGVVAPPREVDGQRRPIKKGKHEIPATSIEPTTMHEDHWDHAVILPPRLGVSRATRKAFWQN
jgi:hypothetical protein